VAKAATAATVPMPLGVTVISQRLMFYSLSCNNILGLIEAGI